MIYIKVHRLHDLTQFTQNAIRIDNIKILVDVYTIMFHKQYVKLDFVTLHFHNYHVGEMTTTILTLYEDKIHVSHLLLRYINWFILNNPRHGLMTSRCSC